MELITNRCTQCMGEVVPMSDGIHAKCPFCGSVYLLPKEERAQEPPATPANALAPADVDDDYAAAGEFDLEAIVEEVMGAEGVFATSTLWGDDVPQKEDAARKFFGVPRADDVFLILDTTIFGSCKVGMALATSGIYMKDEDGAVRAIDWGEFEDVAFSYDDGTLEVDGSKLFSTDGEYVFDVLERAREALGQAAAAGEFDLEAIVEEVMGADGVFATSTLWGDDVPQKEDAARKFFGVPRADDVFLILDTTIFGSCKVGMALATSGIFMKDEDGAVRAIDWGEFEDVAFSYDDGTLEVDGSKLFSTDGEYVFDVLDQAYRSLY